MCPPKIECLFSKPKFEVASRQVKIAHKKTEPAPLQGLTPFSSLLNDFQSSLRNTS